MKARPSTRTSRSTGTSARGELSRAAILKAAIPLFAKSGFRGTTMASVAAAADLTQPGLLHHFPSKEALLHALIEQRYHEDIGWLDDGPMAKEAGLLAALEALVEHNSESEDSVRLFTVLVAESLSVEHPAHGYFVERYRQVRQRLATRLNQDQQAGRLSKDLDADAVAGVLVAVMDGLQTQWLLDPRFDMVGAFRAFAELLGYHGDDAPRSTFEPANEE